jgi:hypothetical protein
MPRKDVSHFLREVKLDGDVSRRCRGDAHAGGIIQQHLVRLLPMREQ